MVVGIASVAAPMITGILGRSSDCFEPSSEGFITHRPKRRQRYIKGWQGSLLILDIHLKQRLSKAFHLL